MRTFLAGFLFAALAWITPAGADPVYQSQTYQCTRSAQTTTVGTTDKLVTGLGTLGSGAQPQIYVCGFDFFPAGSTPSFSLFWATAGTNCASSAGTVVPAITPTAGSPVIDNRPFYSGLPAVPNGNDLCATLAGSGSLLIVYYTQF
jgi:hypothetical protein